MRPMTITCQQCSAEYKMSVKNLLKRAVSRATCKQCGEKIVIMREEVEAWVKALEDEVVVVHDEHTVIQDVPELQQFQAAPDITAAAQTLQKIVPSVSVREPREEAHSVPAAGATRALGSKKAGHQTAVGAAAKTTSSTPSSHASAGGQKAALAKKSTYSVRRVSACPTQKDSGARVPSASPVGTSKRQPVAMQRATTPMEDGRREMGRSPIGSGAVLEGAGAMASLRPSTGVMIGILSLLCLLVLVAV